MGLGILSHILLRVETTNLFLNLELAMYQHSGFNGNRLTDGDGNSVLTTL